MPSPSASGAPKVMSRRATARSKPSRNGMRAIRSTSTATTSDCTRAPTTKQYAPAPLSGERHADERVEEEADRDRLHQRFLLEPPLDDSDGHRRDAVQHDGQGEQAHQRRRVGAAGEVGERRGGQPEQRVPRHAEGDRHGGRGGRHVRHLAAPLDRGRDHAHVVHVDDERVGRQGDRVEPEVLRGQQADQHEADREGTELEDEVPRECPPEPAAGALPERRDPVVHLLTHDRRPSSPAPARSRATSTRTRAGSWPGTRPRRRCPRG